MSDPISAAARNCTRCGKPLSRYNSGTHCQACVSAGRNNGCSRQAGNGSPLVDRVKLAQLRHDRGWTQEMLAGYAGLSLEMVRKLEQRMRTSARLSTLNALAQALDVQVGVLLPDNPVAEPAEGLARPANMKGNAIQASDHARPTLLRALITERHWQRFGTFEAQFRRAARELAERESDPDVANLTVSSRQWERWYMGSVKTEPHPDACRVLEHMFGYPIQQLLAPAISADSDTLRRDVLKFGLLATASPEIVYRTLRDAAGIMRPDPSHAVTELCGMLMDYGFNPSRYGSALDGELPSTQDLERDVRFAFNAYQQGRFTAAASRVSALLTDAQFLARECKEAERSGVQKVLALSYQAAASILTKVGESDLALIAAERGLNMAGRRVTHRYGLR